jgi:hypothetical protein
LVALAAAAAAQFSLFNWTVLVVGEWRMLDRKKGQSISKWGIGVVMAVRDCPAVIVAWHILL